LRVEVEELKNKEISKETKQDRPVIVNAVSEIVKEKQTDTHQKYEQQKARPSKRPQKVKSDLEKFIGEDLISKIGIAITVIGVAIGAKYSIEHDLTAQLQESS